MSRNFLITGTDARVGKTMLGCALAFAFKVRGMRVGVMKPLAFGCVEDRGTLVSADGAALVASASSDLSMDLVSPYRFRTMQFASGSALSPDFDRIVEAHQEIALRSDVIIVEDTGGLAGSIGENHDFADLAIELGLEPIVVVTNQGGFVEASARVADYATRRGVTIRGFVLNVLSRESSVTVEQDAQAVAQRTGMSCIGMVRFKEPVSLAIVEQLV